MARHAGDGDDADSAVELPRFFQSSTARDLLSHGICGPCFERVGAQAEIDRAASAESNRVAPGRSG
jgi:hypothetical protein